MDFNGFPMGFQLCKHDFSWCSMGIYRILYGISFPMALMIEDFVGDFSRGYNGFYPSVIKHVWEISELAGCCWENHQTKWQASHV